MAKAKLTHSVAVALGAACGVKGCWNRPAAYSQVCLGHKAK